MSVSTPETPISRRFNRLTTILIVIIIVLSLAVITLIQERTTTEIEVRKYICSIEMAEDSDLWRNCVYGSAVIR